VISWVASYWCRIFRVVWCIALLSACRGEDAHVGKSHMHGVQSVGDFERGRHGGRLLRSGEFAVEVAIFETGVPPRFRIYGYQDERQLSATEFAARVDVTRLGGRVESFALTPTDGFLTSNQEVVEPHSFDVNVVATHNSQEYVWSYASPEGQTILPKAVADSSGIVVERAGPREIKIAKRIRGKVVPSEHRIAHIIPRFSGIVREGRKHIGDAVQKGEVLAIIESNQSLQPFEVRSQIAGTVISGHLIVGEFVPENQWVYIVADLSEVWIDCLVPLAEREGLHSGQGVVIYPHGTQDGISGTLSYVAPYADERSQSQLVRAIVPNTQGELLPGMFVAADLTVDTITPAVVVKRSAIQHTGKSDVVFVRYGDVYETRPIAVGRGDRDWVEVKTGLSVGDDYVTENSFLVKADILKSGASHDH
jgi:cobalt-zinc-cadmium efflux system membrane fusion protein